MAAISPFRVTQHSQIFSLFFRNQIQCIALYQLHNSRLYSTYIVATLVILGVLCSFLAATVVIASCNDDMLKFLLVFCLLQVVYCEADVFQWSSIRPPCWRNSSFLTYSSISVFAHCQRSWCSRVVWCDIALAAHQTIA